MICEVLDVSSEKIITHFCRAFINGIEYVGRIVTKSMSYSLHLCDCSVPYCTVPPWKPVTGLELDNTCMQVTPGHQLGQF